MRVNKKKRFGTNLDLSKTSGQGVMGFLSVPAIFTSSRNDKNQRLITKGTNFCLSYRTHKINTNYSLLASSSFCPFFKRYLSWSFLRIQKEMEEELHPNTQLRRIENGLNLGNNMSLVSSRVMVGHNKSPNLN